MTDYFFLPFYCFDWNFALRIIWSDLSTSYIFFFRFYSKTTFWRITFEIGIKVDDFDIPPEGSTMLPVKKHKTSSAELYLFITNASDLSSHYLQVIGAKQKSTQYFFIIYKDSWNTFLGFKHLNYQRLSRIIHTDVFMRKC